MIFVCAFCPKHCQLFTWSATWCLRLFTLRPCISFRSLLGCTGEYFILCAAFRSTWKDFIFYSNLFIVKSYPWTSLWGQNCIFLYCLIRSNCKDLNMVSSRFIIKFLPSCHPCPGGKGGQQPAEFLTKAFFVWNHGDQMVAKMRFIYSKPISLHGSATKLHAS